MIKNKNFLIIAIGQLMSQFGNTLQRIALSLYILDITGSAKIFSVVIAIAMIPQILLAPIGGAIADRLNKKKIMIALDMLSGIILLAFTFSVSAGSLSVIAVGTLVFILQILDSMYDPSARAAIVNVVDKNDLEKANGIMTEIMAISMLLGPVAAGILYGIYGIKVVFIINVISFFISAILESFLKIKYTKMNTEQSAIKVFINDTKGTVNFLYKKNRFLLSVIILGTTINIFLVPIYAIGVPYIEKELYKASNTMYGISEGIIGLSMIIGALITSHIAKKLPIEKIDKLFMLLLIPEAIMLIAVMPFILNHGGVSYLAYIIFTFSTFLFAMIITILSVICNTYIQTKAPKNMIGKITSIDTVLSLIFITIGQGIFGILYSGLSKNLFLIYVIVGICTLLSSLVYKKLVKKYFIKKEKLKEGLNNNNIVEEII